MNFIRLDYSPATGQFKYCAFQQAIDLGNGFVNLWSSVNPERASRFVDCMIEKYPGLATPEGVKPTLLVLKTEIFEFVELELQNTLTQLKGLNRHRSQTYTHGS